MHVAEISRKMKSVNNVLVRKSEGECPFWRPKYRQPYKTVNFVQTASWIKLA
jgi:hypothetical protein